MPAIDHLPALAKNASIDELFDNLRVRHDMGSKEAARPAPTESCQRLHECDATLSAQVLTDNQLSHITRSGGHVIKTTSRLVCHMTIGMTLVVAGALLSSPALATEPLASGPRLLMAQAVPITPEYRRSGRPMDESARVVVGHWRKTRIVFEEPEDEHLVLHADGTAENWTVTASSRSARTSGKWTVEGKMLHLRLEGSEEISQPFTIHEEQLVFPNIPGRRGFWEKIGG